MQCRPPDHSRARRPARPPAGSVTDDDRRRRQMTDASETKQNSKTASKVNACRSYYYGTEACPVNSAVRHSLQFALNRAFLKILGAFSKDTHQDICKYFGIWTVEEQISACKSKFNLRYCSSESAVCQAISKLR